MPTPILFEVAFLTHTVQMKPKYGWENLGGKNQFLTHTVQMKLIAADTFGSSQNTFLTHTVQMKQQLIDI